MWARWVVSFVVTLVPCVVLAVPVQTPPEAATCEESETTVGSALLQSRAVRTESMQINVTGEGEESARLNQVVQKARAAELMFHHRQNQPDGEEHSQYKLTITENYGANGCGGDTTCIQFAELNLYHEPAPNARAEVSYEGATFEQGEHENSPDREPASNAFDNDPDTKYLTRRGRNTKVLTITLGTPAAVDDLSFTTGNDDASRDPKRFTLEGSNDGETWDMIIDKSGQDFPQTDPRRTETATANGAGAPANDEPSDGGSAGSGDDGGSAGSGDDGGSAGSGGDAPKLCYEARSVPRCGACTSSGQCECQGSGNFCCPSMKKCRCGGGCGSSPEGFVDLLPTC